MSLSVGDGISGKSRMHYGKRRCQEEGNIQRVRAGLAGAQGVRRQTAVCLQGLRLQGRLRIFVIKWTSQAQSFWQTSRNVPGNGLLGKTMVL